VDRGGYAQRDYWREPFSERGAAIPWAAAVARFVDRSGRPGPATWQHGTYRADQADLPVGGVSWYEAAAFAVFAGKRLPSIYHWYRAADLGRFADILTVSNFAGKGPARVGTYAGVGAFGTYDMAGNVKEWCLNETDGRRFLLGGGWDEPRYMFSDYDARDPLERKPTYGFRLAQYPEPASESVTAAVNMAALNGHVANKPPVADDIFDVYRRQYAYDHTALDVVVEATEEIDVGTKQTVAFATANGEKVRAYVILPRGVAPPWQAVVFFPAADAVQLRSSRDMALGPAYGVVGSGRAFVYPIYQGTYERGGPPPAGPQGERDLVISWSRDLGRTIDYLQTRGDIDTKRLAFYGISFGAGAGVILTAIEQRFAASVLQGAGLYAESVPEIDPRNFAPRVVVPTLMLNGRYDFESPFETSQRPLFELLGAPAGRKTHVVLESGHALPRDAVTREILAWLDRYLGPVTRAGS
jgi:dienelactone hydrolase